MSNNAKKTGPFDVKTVEALVALMKENELNEIYLRDGNQQLRLRRGAMAAAVVPASVPLTPVLSHVATNAAKLAAAPADGPSAAKKSLLEIKSETVGTFYAQPKPGEPAFVKLGDRVTPTKVVGLVEVMKTYNEIQANCTGAIAEILVENGKYVEFGEVLYRVDPS